MTDYHGFLNPDDGVAISFWIISISMVASTVFFLMESMNVGYHWKTSMNVGALVTLVARYTGTSGTQRTPPLSLKILSQKTWRSFSCSLDCR